MTCIILGSSIAILSTESQKESQFAVKSQSECHAHGVTHNQIGILLNEMEIHEPKTHTILLYSDKLLDDDT